MRSKKPSTPVPAPVPALVQPLPRGAVVLVDWGTFSRRESVLAHIANIMGRHHPGLRTNDAQEFSFIDNKDAEFFEECLQRYAEGVTTRRKEDRL
jgi:hypothetical protein